MIKVRSLLLFLPVVAVLLAVFFYIDGEPAATLPEPLPGGVNSLSLTLPGVGLKPPLTLSQWHGRPILINFWASWCNVCREERPALAQLQAAHADAMVGIATTDKPELVAAAEHDHTHGYPIGVDADGKIAHDFGVEALPQTLIFDATGRLVRRFRGPLSSLDIAAADKLLQLPAAVR